MNFTQEPPDLENQYEQDRVLQSYLKRVLPDEVMRDIEPDLHELGELVAGELLDLKQKDRGNEPTLRVWDAWGNKVDQIEKTEVWKRAESVALDFGMVATAYEEEHGQYSRLHQLGMTYLFGPVSETYTCPLAMTDGAARTLLKSGNQELIDRVVPRLTSRDPEKFWTSGQWMTETSGGSDVGRSRTEARQEDGTWRLYGRKWFTSAASSDVALTLARPEGNPPGGKGLALFYVKARDDDGSLRNIRINRLKDKLGTCQLPTAELTLDGTPAEPVDGLRNGVKKISPILNLTRTWNAVGSVSAMRRGIALARNYSRKRKAFGSPLSEKPLHVDTLAGLQAEMEGAFQLAFRIVRLLGKVDSPESNQFNQDLFRSLTSVAKLTTAKQAVDVVSEVLECFGGAGYVEDTGIPQLLRDAQVLPLWEGTTNVLALDFLRSLQEMRRIEVLHEEMKRVTASVTHPELSEIAQQAHNALQEGFEWLEGAYSSDREELESGARRFALTVGRAFELAYLCRQAQWSRDHEEDRRPELAAHRLLGHGVNKIRNFSTHESAALANDEPYQEIDLSVSTVV